MSLLRSPTLYVDIYLCPKKAELRRVHPDSLKVANHNFPLQYATAVGWHAHGQDINNKYTMT
jgi:hypothetical protein